MARELAPVSINTQSGASLLEDEWSFPFLAAVLERPKLRSAWQLCRLSPVGTPADARTGWSYLYPIRRWLRVTAAGASLNCGTLQQAAARLYLTSGQPRRNCILGNARNRYWLSRSRRSSTSCVLFRERSPAEDPRGVKQEHCE